SRSVRLERVTWVAMRKRCTRKSRTQKARRREVEQRRTAAISLRPDSHGDGPHRPRTLAVRQGRARSDPAVHRSLAVVVPARGGGMVRGPLAPAGATRLRDVAAVEPR